MQISGVERDELPEWGLAERFDPDGRRKAAQTGSGGWRKFGSAEGASLRRESEGTGREP